MIKKSGPDKFIGFQFDLQDGSSVFCEAFQELKDDINEDFAFAEWIESSYIRLNGVWCHKHKPQIPDNYHTTQELYDAWKKYYGE